MESGLAGARVTVMGLGRFGGGVGVTRWLASQGAEVLVTDRSPAEDLADARHDLDDLARQGIVRFRLGEHNVSDFTTADLVVANPAVPKPWDDRFLRAAQAARVPVTTEIRLLTERVDRQRVIGVTGSAGKSTTASMIHHILRHAGHRSHLGGNIGGTLLNSLHQIRPDDWVVLELSSAMLHWLGAGVGRPDAAGWSPHVAVITNISPNHVDWHGSFEHYKQSKLNILKHQAPGDHQVRGDDLGPPASGPSLKLPGRHNQINAWIAAEAVRRAVGISSADAVSLLHDFSGLPHRLQLVLEVGGQRFYNDSKSTTPEATMLAVEAFDDPASIHLIVGGYDKGSDLSGIAGLAPRIAGLYAVGVTASAIASAAPAQGHVEVCGTLERAVLQAMQRMGGNDVLLLSPGCASWDQFINFEHRGDRFTELVKAAAGSHSRM